MAKDLPEIDTIDWGPGEETLLEPGKFHVWKINLDEWNGREAALWDILSEAERERAERFRFNDLRVRYTIVHGCLRLILARYLGQDASSISFITKAKGKPELVQPGEAGGPRLAFNISHSGEVALAAISLQLEVGIDLESIKPDFKHPEISTHFFAIEEQAWLAGFLPEQQAAAFYRLWTCKEAVLKGEGSGLTRSLEQVKIDFLDGGLARCQLPAGEHESHEWAIKLFRPEPEYTAALAFPMSASAAEKTNINYYQFSA